MDLKPVANLLPHGIFNIPDYQRGYSWSENQLEEFWEDLVDVEYVDEHYTGTITLIKKKQNEIKRGDNYIGNLQSPIYDVVDGQQRLITIHLFLISIYFRLKELNDSEDEIIRYVIHKNKEYLRLNNEENQDFFKTLLTEKKNDKIDELKSENKTQYNLQSARIFFRKKLHGLKAEKIFGFRNNLLEKFKVNIFELREETEVGMIFETMNDRGLKLSDLDKIKNYLIYLSHRIKDNDLAKETNIKFGKIFNELMKISHNDNITGRTITKIENTFLKNSIIVYSGFINTKDLDDIHRLVKKEIIKKNHSDDLLPMRGQMRKKIMDFTSFLLKSSIQCVLISLKKFENKKVNEHLIKLDKLKKLEYFTPLLLSICTNEGKIKIDKLEKITEELEKFAFRLSFSRSQTNTGVQDLNRLANDIYLKKRNFTDTKQKIKDLTSKNSREEFRRVCLNDDVYGKMDSDIIKYFLYEYEVFVYENVNSNGKIPKFEDFFNQKDISVEHISPQTPQRKDETLKSIDKIGNLVLLEKKLNSTTSNSSFKIKKRTYQRSSFKSVQDIATKEDWNEKSIKARARELSRFANTKWKI